MIWVWGQPADFDHWAYAGNEGWDYAHLKPIFQSVETCARENPNADRGTHGPLHVEPAPEPSPLTTGFSELARNRVTRFSMTLERPFKMVLAM